MALNKKKGSFIPSNPHAATAQIAGKAGGPSVRVILLDGSVVTISLVDVSYRSRCSVSNTVCICLAPASRSAMKTTSVLPAPLTSELARSKLVCGFVYFTTSFNNNAYKKRSHALY